MLFKTAFCVANFVNTVVTVGLLHRILALCGLAMCVIIFVVFFYCNTRMLS